MSVDGRHEPIALPSQTSEPLAAAEMQVVTHVAAAEAAADRSRMVGGVAATLAAATTCAVMVWAEKYIPTDQLTLALPHVEEAQRAVTSIDDVLAPIGQVLIPTALATVGMTKLAARFSDAARFADEFSAREPSHDGRRRGRLMRRVGLAAAGASLATFTAGIATEVSNGPERPIHALNAMLPGNTLVVQYPEAMPMVDSNLDPQLLTRIRAHATSLGVPTHSFSLSLGSYVGPRGETRTDLIAGLEVDGSSPLSWNARNGCNNVPVALDEASGVAVGETVTANGVTVRVVRTLAGASSMNRIGGLMDEKAVKECLQGDPDAPSHGLVVEADQETVANIVRQAQAEFNAPAAVTTKDQYAQNSRKFWESNVQPITNVLSLAAGAMAFLAMTSAMGARLLRNRRELAAMLADGTSTGMIRFAEIIRSTKDGILATTLGVLSAVPLTAAANSLEAGFRAGVGVREALIGSALGLLGTIGGGVLSLVGLKHVANPEEHTRA